MLAPRLSLAPSLAVCSFLGFVGVAGVGGCQGPDTFLRSGIGAGGSPSGFGGFNIIGAGGHGTGGMTGVGGMGVGGGGAGGRGTGGMNGTGGMVVGTGGARDGGADAMGVGGMIVNDGGADRDGGLVGGTGPCANICAAATTVVNFTLSPGIAYHSPMPVTLGEACFATLSNVQGVNCSNFSGRTLSVNGVPEPGCGGNFAPPGRVNGGYCFQFSAGTPDFAQIAVF